jgi:uncharacterized protein DUF3168
MIEQGLVLLVQGTPAVSAIASAGGFFVELPKEQALPSWTYSAVSDVPDYALSGPTAMHYRRIQIDCFGIEPAEVIRLAGAIDNVLSGFHGTLTDPETVKVQGCFRTNLIDFFEDDPRNFRRMLEYELWFGS